jgi:hypothetical protein
VPAPVQDTVSATAWPLSTVTEDGDIVTVAPVNAAFTVTVALAQTPAGGVTLFTTRTEYIVVEVRGPVTRVDAVWPCNRTPQDDPVYH